MSWCGPTNYCTGTTVVAVKAGIRGSSTCGTSSAAVELKCRYLVLQCQDGLKWSEFHIMHYFQNRFKLQSQQVARLTAGCPLAQGLVVGASRDIQRQKLKFPPLPSFAVPLLPHSFCRARASVRGWACGQQDPGLLWHCRDWHLQPGLARGSRGLSLATRP